MPFPSSPPEAGGWPIPIWRPRGPPHLPKHKKILNLLSPRPKLDVPLSLPLGKPPRLTKPPRRVSFQDDDTHRRPNHYDTGRGLAGESPPDLTFSESEASPIPAEVLTFTSPKSPFSSQHPHHPQSTSQSRSPAARFSGQTFGPMSPQSGHAEVRRWASTKRQSKVFRVSTLVEGSEPVTPDTLPDHTGMSPLLPPGNARQELYGPGLSLAGGLSEPMPNGYSHAMLDRPRESDGTQGTGTTAVDWFNSRASGSSPYGMQETRASSMVMPLPQPLVRRSSRRSTSTRSSRSDPDPENDYYTSVKTSTAQRVRLSSQEKIIPNTVHLPTISDIPPRLPRIDVGPLFLPPLQPPPDRPPPLPPKPWSKPLQSLYPSLTRPISPRSKTPFPFSRPEAKRKPSNDPSTSGTSSFDTAPDPADEQIEGYGPLPPSLELTLDGDGSGQLPPPSPDDSTTPSELILSHHRNSLLHFLRLLHCLSLARELLYARNLVSITLLATSPFPPDVKRDWERRLDDWWLTSSGILNMARQRVRASLKSAEKDWEWAVEVMGGEVGREKKGLTKFWEEEEKPGWNDANDDAAWPWEGVGSFNFSSTGLTKLAQRNSKNVSSSSNHRRGGLSRTTSGGLKKRKSMLELRAEREEKRKGVPSWVGEVVNECFGYDQVEEEVWNLELEGKIPTGTWRRMYGQRAFNKAGKARIASDGSANPRAPGEAEAPGDFGKLLGGMNRRPLSEIREVSERALSGPSGGGIIKAQENRRRRIQSVTGRSTDVGALGGWWIMDDNEIEEARLARVDQVGADRNLGLARDEWRSKGAKKGKRWSMLT